MELKNPSPAGFSQTGMHCLTTSEQPRSGYAGMDESRGSNYVIRILSPLPSLPLLTLFLNKLSAWGVQEGPMSCSLNLPRSRQGGREGETLSCKLPRIIICILRPDHLCPLESCGVCAWACVPKAGPQRLKGDREFTDKPCCV